jgi:hypothetical protein
VVDPDELDQVSSEVLLAFELGWSKDPKERLDLHTLLPPPLPTHLSPGQAAQLTELLQFLHLRIRTLAQTVKLKSRADRVTLDQRQWQALVDMEARLAEYLRSVGDPDV